MMYDFLCSLSLSLVTLSLSYMTENQLQETKYELWLELVLLHSFFALLRESAHKLDYHKLTNVC